jgi:hypothetical protein
MRLPFCAFRRGKKCPREEFESSCGCMPEQLASGGAMIPGRAGWKAESEMSLRINDPADQKSIVGPRQVSWRGLARASA